MTIPTGKGPRRPRTEHFTTSQLLAALTRLGGAGTSAEIAAEALGEERATASQRVRAGQFLAQAHAHVRQSAGSRVGYGKADVWRLRDHEGETGGTAA